MAKRNSEGMRELDFSTYKTAGKSYQPPENLDGMGEVITMGLQAIKSNDGLQVSYPNDEGGLKRFYERAVSYFERINQLNSAKSGDQKPVVPDFEGLALWCGVSRISLYGYSKRGGKWLEMIDLFKTLITSARKQITTTYQVPPMWEIFNLTNNSVGYYNTAEFKLTTERIEDDKPPLPSAEEIMSRHRNAELPELPEDDF